jgi:hypothetical protein
VLTWWSPVRKVLIYIFEKQPFFHFNKLVFAAAGRETNDRASGETNRQPPRSVRTNRQSSATVHPNPDTGGTQTSTAGFVSINHRATFFSTLSEREKDIILKEFIFDESKSG